MLPRYLAALGAGVCAVLPVWAGPGFDPLFDLNRLNPDHPNYDNDGPLSLGAILAGRNAQDLAGADFSAVTGLADEGARSLLITSRFAKPLGISFDGVGFGEGYLLQTASDARLRDVVQLSGVGGPHAGVRFRGVRMPLFTKWTQGIAAAIPLPDMDGDGRPELAFSFPRTESLSLSETSPSLQSVDLLPDLPGLGALEFNANNSGAGFTTGRAQLARGGIVIVSSQNPLFVDPERLNRRGARVIDLHEAGQAFSEMSIADLELYIAEATETMPSCVDCLPGETADCGELSDNPNETNALATTMRWDVTFVDQGPGGFLVPWTETPVDPPLANPIAFAFSLSDVGAVYPELTPCPQVTAPGQTVCATSNEWLVRDAGASFPCTTLSDIPAWDTEIDFNGDALTERVWTGFYPPDATPLAETTGARVLGREVGDRFGTTIAADDRLLYVAAPQHTPTAAEIESLGADRPQAGIVYALNLDRRPTEEAPNQAQLWIDPADRVISDPENPDETLTIPASWPFVDAHAPQRADFTMPTPHQYIVDAVGSLRGDASEDERDLAFTPEPPCPPPFDPDLTQATAEACADFPDDRTEFTAASVVSSVVRFVGPHSGARVQGVIPLGDINDDGLTDVALLAPDLRGDFADPLNPTGATVGGVFVVFGGHGQRDVMLEDIAADLGDPDRISGLLIRGTENTTLQPSVAAAGDVDGDGINDLLVGSPTAAGGAGEAVLIFGSATFNTPAGGWTPDQFVAAGRAVRFAGALAVNAGANVSAAGDVDADGFDDVLVAAPAADSGRGHVFLLFGQPEFSISQSLEQVGTIALPGSRFVGLAPGDRLGGGVANVSGTIPGSAEQLLIRSRGAAALGDLDGDGFDDFGLSAMLASPNGQGDAGELYVIYGQPRVPPVDCNGNGVPDQVDLDPADPDGDGFVSDDCNGNGVPDECDVDTMDPDGDGFVSSDCDEDGVPDECAIAAGTAEDCNGNEIPDSCEIASEFLADSGPLGSLDAGNPRTWTVTHPPEAGSDVTITVSVRGDLGALTEYVDISLNGEMIARLFMTTGQECPAQVQAAPITIGASMFNGLVLSGDAVFDVTPSDAVAGAVCATSTVSLAVRYQAFSENDCNGNGVPDICDLLGGTSTDDNGNEIPDECEGCPNDPNGTLCDTDIFPETLGDCVVNNNDLAVVLAAYLSRAGEANYNPRADLSPLAAPDGVVNQFDLALLLADYLNDCR